jgi:hypothetical protein
MMDVAKKQGVFVGRLCPMHYGHRYVLEEMLGKSDGLENTLVVVGSSSAPLTLHNFFSYEQRRSFIRAEFGPALHIVGLPDYPTDAEWLLALDDILRASNIDPERAIYYGGSDENVEFFLDAHRTCHIINRYDGKHTPNISGSEVRDALIHQRSIDSFVGEASRPLVVEAFRENWKRFERM